MKHAIKLIKQRFFKAIFSLLFLGLLVNGAAQAKVHFDYLNGSDLQTALDQVASVQQEALSGSMSE